jgi:hypothetical protein
MATRTRHGYGEEAEQQSVPIEKFCLSSTLVRPFTSLVEPSQILIWR